MNRQAMVAPFAEEELRQFQGRGGKTMTFIEDETVMDRLDAGYGFGNWQLQVDPISDKVVKVRLGVRESGEWVWYEDFGYPNQDGGEALKEAVSDGIRRCGRYVGIARDLYRKSTYEPGGALGPKASPEPAAKPQPAATNGGLIGTLVAQGTQDFALRQTPDGWVLPFRVKEGNKSQIVIAHDQMAQALDFVRDTALNARVTVFGTYTDETLKKGTGDYSYQVLHLSRIVGPDFTIPAPEATSLPLFDEAEAAEIVARELAEAK